MILKKHVEMIVNKTIEELKLDDLSEKVKAEVIEWYEEFCSDEE